MAILQIMTIVALGAIVYQCHIKEHLDPRIEDSEANFEKTLNTEGQTSIRGPLGSHYAAC